MNVTPVEMPVAEAVAYRGLEYYAFIALEILLVLAFVGLAVLFVKRQSSWREGLRRFAFTRKKLIWTLIIAIAWFFFLKNVLFGFVSDACIRLPSAANHCPYEAFELFRQGFCGTCVPGTTIVADYVLFLAGPAAFYLLWSIVAGLARAEVSS